jgi:hypothetical protein
MQQIIIIIFLLFAVLQCQAQSSRPKLTDGVITYVTRNGQKAEIRMEKECADLWVSPDESIIAFITLDKINPLIRDIGRLEESSIYIARKIDNFKRIPITLQPIYIQGKLFGRKIVRQPSLSPDLKTLYFLVPSSMTSRTLFSTSIPSGPNTKITDSEGQGYCVIWGGRYSGDLLLNLRQLGKEGMGYPCFHRNRSGKLIQIGGDTDFAGFNNLALQWSKNNGGICQQPGFTQIW